MHLFLLLLVLMGSAFFVSKDKKPVDMPSLKVVPSILVDQALSGGGGNPKIPPSDARQRGETLTPQPPQVQPAQSKPPAQPVEVKKPTPTTAPKENPLKPKELSKETSKPNTNPKTTKLEPLELKPVVRNDADKAKAKAEAQAKQMAAISKNVASELKRAREGMKQGFKSGTQVEVSGTGGVAYAGYLQFVKTAYDESWQVSQDVTDDDSVALVSVTIRRDGRVLSARIIKASGNAILDKSVQRALDSVKFIRPFPEGARESERTFTIEFNLKAKRLTG